MRRAGEGIKYPEIMSKWSKCVFAFRIKVTLQSVFAQLIVTSNENLQFESMIESHTNTFMLNWRVIFWPYQIWICSRLFSISMPLHAFIFVFNLLIRFASSNNSSSNFTAKLTTNKHSETFSQKPYIFEHGRNLNKQFCEYFFSIDFLIRLCSCDTIQIIIVCQSI